MFFKTQTKLSIDAEFNFLLETVIHLTTMNFDEESRTTILFQIGFCIQNSL